jgi:hypothetical protein
MRIFGLLFGIIAAFGMLLGFIPLLGWINWIVIPFAIIGLIISVLTNSKGGMTLCIVAIFFGLLKLSLGGGII